jgi:predicted TIM-barrel fold metal-dependent hydrolase
MIIDCHCHAGRGTGLTGPWDTSADLGPFLARSARAGIDKTVVLPLFHEDSLKANDELAAVVRSHGGRLIGFAGVHSKKTRGKVAGIVWRAVNRLGFRGLKVHRAESRISREICEVASRYRLPIIYDVFSRPGPMNVIAPEFPDVAFILPHLGSFSDDYKAHMQVIDLLVRYKNVFADTSGVRRFDLLAEAVRRAGARKILFGTDGPWLHPALELQKIRLLRLPARDEQLILGGNLLRLISRRLVARDTLHASRDTVATHKDPRMTRIGAFPSG